MEDRAERVLDGLREFYAAPLRGTPGDGLESAQRLFRDVAATVPAYRAFLASTASTRRAVRDFERAAAGDQGELSPPVPAARAVPRRQAGRLRHGRGLVRLDRAADVLAALRRRRAGDRPRASSRSSTTASAPTSARTLAVVCFALGTWVGGMYTAGLLPAPGRARATRSRWSRPGNNVAEILRVVQRARAALRAGRAARLSAVPQGRRSTPGPAARRRLAALRGQAGAWPARCSARSGARWSGSAPGSRDPCYDSASLYGTADAGVLGNETPLSVCIRRFLAARAGGRARAVRRVAPADPGPVRPAQPLLRGARRHAAVLRRQRRAAGPLPHRRRRAA